VPISLIVVAQIKIVALVVRDAFFFRAFPAALQLGRSQARNRSRLLFLALRTCRLKTLIQSLASGACRLFDSQSPQPTERMVDRQPTRTPSHDGERYSRPRDMDRPAVWHGKLDDAGHEQETESGKARPEAEHKEHREDDLTVDRFEKDAVEVTGSHRCELVARDGGAAEVRRYNSFY
jgi:hypothetical protein